MGSEIKMTEASSLRDLALSEGFQFGLGVFETMRGLPDGIEDFEAHMRRLKDSALVLGIAIPSEFEDLKGLKSYIESCISNPPNLEEDKLHDRNQPIEVVKLTLFKQGNESRWIISERPFSYNKAQFEKGFKLKVSDIRSSSTSLFQRHKTLNYGENWLEKQKAIENGYQEVLFLNENHHLTETSASNLFFYKDGRWHTPDLSCGLLDGIMRRRVMDYLAEKGNAVIEGQFPLDDLLTAEHVLLTNALMGLMPVKSIDFHGFETVINQEIINCDVIDSARIFFELGNHFEEKNNG